MNSDLRILMEWDCSVFVVSTCSLLGDIMAKLHL